MHTFLANLTELHYKILGLTVIYIPQEGVDLSVEAASKDKELVKRLEGTILFNILVLITCVFDLITYSCSFVLVQSLGK
jgi:dynein heavy chain